MQLVKLIGKELQRYWSDYGDGRSVPAVVEAALHTNPFTICTQVKCKRPIQALHSECLPTLRYRKQ